MSRRRVAILGAGGHAREMLAALRAGGRGGGDDCDVVGFLVDPGYAAAGSAVDSLPVLGDLGWLGTADAAGVELLCGIGSPAARWRMVGRARDHGARFASLVHPAAVCAEPWAIAEGVYLAAGCVVSVGVRLGAHAHLDSGCTVAHDVDVGEWASVAPGAHVAGGARLGSGCFVGLGANVLEGRAVGEWAIVGAGSTVTADVPANSTVVGAPARVVATREPGWQSLAGRQDPF